MFCIYDILFIYWISMKGNLYMISNYVNCLWNSILVWLFKRIVPNLISTCISWWLCFTSHGHGDVKLIMWAHVWHGAGLTQFETCLSLLHNAYVLSLDLRLSYVLKMWIDLLRDYQTLHRNWVVIKVVFGFVKKHAVRHGQSRWDLPLSIRERYLWAPRVIGSRNAWPC